MKKKYFKPQISKVRVDNQISLVMMSEGAPPHTPFQTEQLKNFEDKNNPYKA